MQIDNYKEEMAARLESLNKSIAETAVDCNRNPADITIIGVSKFFPAENAQTAYELGLNNLGENRVQEMIAKMDQLHAAGIEPNWHLIGTLQKNKVKYVIGRTQLIHSVDSIGLIDEIDRRSIKRGIISKILLQVNVSGETSKHGFCATDITENIANWSKFAGIEIRGLMTMAPIAVDPEETTPVFAKTRDLAQKLQELVPDQRFDILSMGMSQDYRQAIRCGATHIRIGTAIFGPRIK